MRAEVADFFEGNRTSIEKMIAVGHRQGLTPESIKEAAAVVYDDFTRGADIKPIRLVWAVFEKAKHIHTKVTAQVERDKDSYNKAVAVGIPELNAKIDLLIGHFSLPWWRRIFNRIVWGR